MAFLGYIICVSVFVIFWIYMVQRVALTYINYEAMVTPATRYDAHQAVGLHGTILAYLSIMLSAKTIDEVVNRPETAWVFLVCFTVGMPVIAFVASRLPRNLRKFFILDESQSAYMRDPVEY